MQDRRVEGEGVSIYGVLAWGVGGEGTCRPLQVISRHRLADQVMATVDAQGTPFAQHVEAAPRGMGTFIEEEQIPNAVS